MSRTTFDVVSARDPGVSWRVFEMECLEKHFGQFDEGLPADIHKHNIMDCGAKYLYWKLHTESTDEKLLEHCCKVAKELGNIGIKQINNPNGWINCHAKEKAFKIWKDSNIPCPRCFSFRSHDDFTSKNKRACFKYPFLVRFNNSTSGWFSYLVHNEVELKQAVLKLESSKDYHHDKIPNNGVGRKMLAVQFISTTRPENLNMSFRIIVAGNKVVAGYARLSPAKDWIAITNRFDSSMEKPFVKYQKVCQEFCEKNERLIVKAVKCLGLNFQVCLQFY